MAGAFSLSQSGCRVTPQKDEENRCSAHGDQNARGMLRQRWKRNHKRRKESGAVRSVSEVCKLGVRMSCCLASFDESHQGAQMHCFVQ